MLEAFWGILELEHYRADSMGALFSLERDFLGSTSAILDGFGNLLGRFFKIFWYLLTMQLSQCIFI